MIRSIRRSQVLAVCFALGAVLVPCAGARAGQVLYVFAGSGTGRAGDVEFDDAEFTITLTADTADVVETDPGLFSVSGRSTVDIAGVGAGDFLIATRVFSSFSAFVEIPAVGFSILGSGDGPDLVDLTDPAFAGYKLRAPFGPVVEREPTAVHQFRAVETGIGPLTFDSISVVRFQAVAVPLPPAAWTGLMAAAGATGLYHMRRQLRPRAEERTENESRYGNE